MSAIASFILMPKSALDALREAAPPKRSWLGKPKDIYNDFLAQHGRVVARYEWSGYILATLLPYLEEQKIDLMHADFDELSTYLTQKRGKTHFIFTDAHKRAHLARLAPQSFSEAELRDYYNEFNATSEPEAGKAMLDGIRAIEQSLQSLDESSVIVFSIG
jgi:hypothetical protein